MEIIYISIFISLLISYYVFKTSQKNTLLALLKEALGVFFFTEILFIGIISGIHESNIVKDYQLLISLLCIISTSLCIIIVLMGIELDRRKPR